jgi:signal transduction histidine kinase
VSGVDQLQLLSWIVYVVIFIAVLVRAVGRPTPAHVDMALFFGATVVVILIQFATLRLGFQAPSWVGDVLGGTAIALGYLLLRLVRDFRHVPLLLIRVSEAAVVLAVVAIAALPPPLPPAVGLAFVGYLTLAIAYSAVAFYGYSRRTRGVTHRRMQAAALGSVCFVLILVTTALAIFLPGAGLVIREAGAVAGLGSGLSYFVAFAPPTWLRRAWQEPELRAFVGRVPTLARMTDLRSMVHQLERAAADALGAPAASLALWDPDTARLHVYAPEPSELAEAEAKQLPMEDWEVDPTLRPPAFVAFIDQHAMLITDLRANAPDGSDQFRRFDVQAVLGAPITAYGKRLGTLLIYAQRAPIFANSDLELVQLLADQAAVVLESRTLIDEEARVRAREEAARLKEDFLSSAAHDLKTPLTGIVTQAQVLMRRVDRDPTAPADRAGLTRLMQQSLRLRDLVLELLDASRLEQGQLIGKREPTDIVALVESVIDRDPQQADRVVLDTEGPVTASVDALRFDQVVTNLLENALKYSPRESTVRVRVWQADDQVRLSVTDQGIGIPSEDQPLVFERFHRARNVDDRRFAGMGLGLYIARSIVVEHGGRIWVESTRGAGSTFQVAVPLEPA